MSVMTAPDTAMPMFVFADVNISVQGKIAATTRDIHLPNQIVIADC